MITGFRHDETM